MADEEIVSGLSKVENQIVRQREDDAKQTSRLAESIDKLRAESNQKSDGIVGTLTSSLEKNAAEVVSEFVVQRADHRWQKEHGIDQVDDKVDEVHTTLRSGNVERKTLLQRIAAWVNPDMQGSKDRERDLENKLRFEKQTAFFANMTKSLAGMVVRPIRTTAAGIWTFLKGLAFGGALLALLNFLDGDTWKDWQEWVVKRLPKKVEQLKSIFKAIMDGDFMKAWDEIGVMLGLWTKDLDPSKTSAWDLFKKGVTSFLLAFGALALIFAPKAALMVALRLAWLAGTGWLFVAPVIALFTALGKLPDAARRALGNIGKIGAGLAPPASGTMGFSSGGSRFEATRLQGPPTQAGQVPVNIKPVGPPGPQGPGVVTPQVQAAAQRLVSPQNAWQALAAKFGAAGPMFKYASKALGAAGAGLMGYNLYKIWLDNTGDYPYEGARPLNTTQQMNETIVQLGAFNAATLVGALVSAGLITAGVGPWGALAAALAVGGAAFFGAETGLRPLVEWMFGSGSDKKKATDWVEKGLKAEENTKKRTSLQDLGGVGGSTSPAVASRIGAGQFRGASVTPLPTANPVANQLENASFDKATRGITSTAMGDMTPPIVSTNNQQINNNNNVQVAAKDIARPDPILNAVNYAYG